MFLPPHHVWVTLPFSNESGVHSPSMTAKSALYPALSTPVSCSRQQEYAALVVAAESAVAGDNAKCLLVVEVDSGSLAERLVVAIYWFSNAEKGAVGASVPMVIVAP